MVSEQLIPRIQKVTAVFWPSFLAASAATVVFFALFDPVTVLECNGEAPWTRTAAYSIGFLLFWLLASVSSAVTTYFLHPTAGVQSKGPGS